MTPTQNLPAHDRFRGLTFLDDVKVLDLTTSIAGPYATQLLGDLGATVAKIERPPHGDDCRAWGPPFLDGESLWFIAVNRNKLSVALDYSTQTGSAVLRRLVESADVVVVNQVASAQRKLGIDYQTLRNVRSDLIHASITGFGLTGKRSEMPCYDLIAEGYSGVMDLTGRARRPAAESRNPCRGSSRGAGCCFGRSRRFGKARRNGRGMRDRRIPCRQHDAIHGAEARPLSWIRSVVPTVGGDGQRDCHLPDLRHRGRAVDAWTR